MMRRLIGGLVGMLLAVTLASPVGATAQQADQKHREAARPGATLHIPRLRVAAQVFTVGRTASGDLQVPTDIRRVGLDLLSAPIGSLHGTSLLAGHKDDDQHHHGALYRLAALRKGDIVRVRSGGHTYRYRVTSRVFTSADRPLPPGATRLTGLPRLAISTCGGPLRIQEDGLLHYSERITVYAVMRR